MNLFISDHCPLSYVSVPRLINTRLQAHFSKVLISNNDLLRGEQQLSVFWNIEAKGQLEMEARYNSFTFSGKQLRDEA